MQSSPMHRNAYAMTALSQLAIFNHQSSNRAGAAAEEDNMNVAPFT
jgi:hypothetical protein